jgi:hypothetical protein
VRKLLFERGANAVQVQRWLGHHSPSFTLNTYVHLLDEDGMGEALDLGAELVGVNGWGTRPTETEQIPEPPLAAEILD